MTPHANLVNLPRPFRAPSANGPGDEIGPCTFRPLLSSSTVIYRVAL